MCQDAGKDRFVIVGLQRGAVFIPARLQSSLLLQDCQSGPAWVLHTPEARGPYLRTGAVPGGEGNAGSVPGLQQRQLQQHRPGSPASPRGTPDHAWPQMPGEEKVPNGSSPAVFPLQTSNVIFLLKIVTVVKLQNKPISKGKQVGQWRCAAKGAHRHAPEAVRRNEAFLQLQGRKPRGQISPYAFPIK